VRNDDERDHLVKIVNQIDTDVNNDQNAFHMAGAALLHVMVGTKGSDDDDLMKQILSLGVNPNVKRDDSWTPLQLAITKGRLKCASLLLDCRAHHLENPPYFSVEQKARFSGILAVSN
jgi:ankyrin repeat protein